ncbi:nucleotide disphospho-sugar-binding domain-containing protein [Streptomyces sp. NPDC012637]|uniref:nucleotide disphospho-sugar-binding domain-containing protein n=1 Tax=Streptomyces sp. NPDC012637 TaxID=3364842 RepID=UPI0036E2F9C3
MRVALITAGSRGDIAPFTGLGHGLVRAGHQVTVVTHESFAGLVREAGLSFHGLPVDPQAELRTEHGRRLLTARSGPGKLARVLAMAARLVEGMAPGMLEAARASDVLLLSGSVAPLGHAIAEGLRLPSRGVYLQPLAPTGTFPPPVVGTRSCGGPGNRLAGHAVNAALDLVFSRAARAVERELGGHLRRSADRRRNRERRNWPVHHGFSPLVVPRPPDWRPGLTIGGYWWPYTSPGAELPGEVRDFLDAGPAPVFVGLGSPTVPDPERVSGLLVRALREAGLRGVIQSGWSGLRADGDDMLTIGEVPHSLLFPHMAAVVHHAGAGTTAAGLRAGVPAVPMPVWFDGAFWASRLTALGVSPGPVPLGRLTTPSPLAAALTAATRDPAYRLRAAALAGRLRQEDGVAPVRAALEQLDDDAREAAGARR